MSGLFLATIRDDKEAQQRVRDWIAALRSGEYKQGTEWLRGKDGYCCLGVACDLLDTSAWSPLRPESTSPSGVYLAPHYDYLPAVGGLGANVLDPTTKDLYRLEGDAGDYCNDGESEDALATDNDNGKTFAEIADTIERELAEVLA